MHRPLRNLSLDFTHPLGYFGYAKALAESPVQADSCVQRLSKGWVHMPPCERRMYTYLLGALA